MSSITYQSGENLNPNQVKYLYEDVRWDVYTSDLEKLLRAINQSQRVITAWDKDQLVGLIRVNGDEETIVYVQDLLVLTSYQNQGIGEELLTKMLNNYPEVDRILLLADEDPNLRRFYEKCGMKDIKRSNIMSYISMA